MDIDKTKRAVGTAVALAGTVKVSRDEQSGEIAKVSFAGIPLFKRDEDGNPKVLGIPFRRWFRGSRK